MVTRDPLYMTWSLKRVIFECVEVMRYNHENINFAVSLLPVRSESFMLPCQPKNVKIKISRSIILPLVLYGRETWFLNRKQEHRLRVFQHRVLRRTVHLKAMQYQEDKENS